MTKCVEQIFQPEILVHESEFIVKFAITEEEKLAAQRLRYQVFCREQKRGCKIDSDFESDGFDEFCLHLIVVRRSDGEVVGTCRVHPGRVAAANMGFYAATEFDLIGIDDIIDESVELGRSCVAPAYRNGSVIAALWAGIAQVMVRGNFRYLLGCVSLESDDWAAAWALYEKLVAQDKLTSRLTARPRHDFVLPTVSELDIERYRALPLRRQLPPLFRGYLGLGGKICGPPVYDRGFGTIDFLVLLDIELIPARYAKHFKCGRNNANYPL